MNFVNGAVTGAILVNGAERTQPAVRVGGNVAASIINGHSGA